MKSRLPDVEHVIVRKWIFLIFRSNHLADVISLFRTVNKRHYKKIPERDNFKETY